MTWELPFLIIKFKQAISYPFFYVINVFENVSTGYSANSFTDVAKIAVPENIQEYSLIIESIVL